MLKKTDSELMIHSIKIYHIFKYELNIKIVNTWSIFQNLTKQEIYKDESERYLDQSSDVFFFIYFKLKFEEKTQLKDIFYQLSQSNDKDIIINCKIFLHQLSSNQDINPLKKYINIVTL